MPFEGQGEGEPTPEQLQTQFQTLAAEADLYSQKSGYQQAIERYTLALNIHPNDKNCLVSRSRCHLLMGNAKAALADADAVLAQDPDFFKAVFQKAEALYAMGDFEFALVHFHRGNRARPEFSEFRVGVQKAREAIENSIGNPREVKIRSLAKGNFGNVKLAGALDGRTGAGTAGVALPAWSMAAAPAAAGALGHHHRSNDSSGSDLVGGAAHNPGAVTIQQPAMEKKLLGELFEDKTYLVELLTEERNSASPNKELYAAIMDGLNYLDSRLEFWRQQNPLYARPKQHVRYFKLKRDADAKLAAAKAASAAKPAAAAPRRAPAVAKPATAPVVQNKKPVAASKPAAAASRRGSLPGSTAKAAAVPRANGGAPAHASKTAQALKNSPLGVRVV